MNIWLDGHGFQILGSEVILLAAVRFHDRLYEVRNMKRSPVVANQFYPGDPLTLNDTLTQLIPVVADSDKKKALAVCSPHAGYIYSGSVAGETLAKVSIPEDVVLMGPNHHGRGAPVALMLKGEWDMPHGTVPINRKLGKKIASLSDAVTEDDTAHLSEHSLEVQVPFLQYFQKNLSLAPIVISHVSYQTCVEVGEAIAEAIRNYKKPVLIVASTDMTHYESRQSATRKDQMALKEIKAMDPEGLYKTVLSNNITMCGVMPTTIALIAAKKLGATSADLVRYTDSGAVSGDTSQVVGYAGVIIS